MHNGAPTVATFGQKLIQILPTIAHIFIENLYILVQPFVNTFWNHHLLTSGILLSLFTIIIFSVPLSSHLSLFISLP